VHYNVHNQHIKVNPKKEKGLLDFSRRAPKNLDELSIT